MVCIRALLALSIVSLVSAIPLEKRIAQTIADSTKDWEQACLKAGGGAKCNAISQSAFTSLLAAGKNCDQQDAADAMIDLAKTLNNDSEMIRLAQIFVQQPRNAPDGLQVPYCQQAPKNSELNGLFHCEFAGSDFTKFSGDQTGNTPLGVAVVNPPGSCPAKPDGPVPDGVQLVTLVNDPGVPTPTGSSAANAAVPTTVSGTGNGIAGVPKAKKVTGTVNLANAITDPTGGVQSSTIAATTADPNAKPFTLQNGKDAIALNQKFATLTPDSPCTDGENACVQGSFAQCVGNKFVIGAACRAPTQCFALPLVNKAGTSVACADPADPQARIAATGAL